MTVVVERLQLLLDASSKGMVAGIKEGETAATGFHKVLDTGKAKLAQYGLMNAETGKLTGTAWAAGGVVAGAAIAKFALDGVEKFAQLTSQVRAFSRVSGATAEDSSKLVFAVKQLGIEPDTAATAFGRLATRIGTGKEHLDQFGVSVATNKDGSIDLAATVANLSDAYQKTTDPTTKAALANEAFGKSWQTLAPLLGKGKDDLKEIYDNAAKDHQIFSADDLEKGRQFTASMNMLKSTLEGLKVELGSALIPVITQMASGFTQGVQGADSAANALGTNGLGGAVNFVNQSLNPLMLGMHGVSAASQLVQGHFGAAAGEFARSIPGIAGVTNMIFGAEEASDKFTEAQQRQKEAQIALANATADGGAKSLGARNATKELASATKELDGMTKGLAKGLDDAAYSADKEKYALLALTQVALGAAGAHLSLEQAGNSVAAANATVAEKTDALSEAVRQYGAESPEAAAAARDLAQANTGLSAANLTLTNATFANDAANKAMIETYRGKLPVLDADIEKLKQQQINYPLAAAAIQPQINQLIAVRDTLSQIPDHKGVTVDVLLNETASSMAEGYGLHVSNGRVQGIRLSHGGFVPGSGDSDTVPAMLTPGEFVVSKDMMNGGGSGAGSSATYVAVNVGGSDELTRMIVDGINRASRGGPVILTAAVG